MLNNSLFDSKKDDWETPQKFFNELHAEFNFTIDGAATAANAKLPCFWTPEHDAFKQEWRNQRIFIKGIINKG